MFLSIVIIILHVHCFIFSQVKSFLRLIPESFFGYNPIFTFAFCSNKMSLAYLRYFLSQTQMQSFLQRTLVSFCGMWCLHVMVWDSGLLLLLNSLFLDLLRRDIWEIHTLKLRHEFIPLCAIQVFYKIFVNLNIYLN